MTNFQPVESVQMFLNNVGASEFAVVCAKKDGTQALFLGRLDTTQTKRGDSVPIMTEEGWKRFDRRRVLWIDYPDQIQGVLELLKVESCYGY